MITASNKMPKPLARYARYFAVNAFKAAFGVCGLLGLLVGGSPTYSSELQSQASIRNTAKRFIEERHPWQNMESRINVAKLDSRSRLPKCRSALQAFLPSGIRVSHRTTVGIQCPDSKGWKVYLPVTVSAVALVLVATRPLAPNTELTRADVQRVKRDVASLGYGYVSSIEGDGGYRTKRSIAQGAVITPVMVEAAVMIRRGQKVTLISSTGPVAVSMAGVAGDDGSLGSRIKVRNVNSGRIVEGIVRSAETVEIAL
ncbi:MAG: flagella basal body P-ring formation protein FlgA [Bermanella sp.]|jgi:flagella basal body P-ring formation protein FlgA